MTVHCNVCTYEDDAADYYCELDCPGKTCISCTISYEVGTKLIFPHNNTKLGFYSKIYMHICKLCIKTCIIIPISQRQITKRMFKKRHITKLASHYDYALRINNIIFIL